MKEYSVFEAMRTLLPFASKSEYRVILKEPAVMGGYVWATDGHILGRIPIGGDIPPLSAKGNFPDCSRVWIGPDYGDCFTVDRKQLETSCQSFALQKRDHNSVSFVQKGSRLHLATYNINELYKETMPQLSISIPLVGENRMQGDATFTVDAQLVVLACRVMGCSEVSISCRDNYSITIWDACPVEGKTAPPKNRHDIPQSIDHNPIEVLIMQIRH